MGFSLFFQLKNVDNIVQRYMKPDSFASMTGDPIWGKINRYMYILLEIVLIA